MMSNVGAMSSVAGIFIAFQPRESQFYFVPKTNQLFARIIRMIPRLRNLFLRVKFRSKDIKTVKFSYLLDFPNPIFVEIQS